MEPALAIWKKHFCDGEYTNCARYQMGLKGEVVPITLLPNGKMIEHKVKSKEEIGGTALFNAILKNRTPMVKSMLSSKMASVDVVANDGSTPLMVAASIGNTEIVEFLLKEGCNPFKTNNDGYDALVVAQRKNFPDCENIIKEYMDQHPELNNVVNSKSENNSESEDDSEISGVVSFLKKLNPFSR
jgi:hypothetical protein